MNSADPGRQRTAPRTRRHDAIVVGARCAGAATAMLLARKGYDVLLVDRASFPSDTVSTHVIHPPGVTALRRWGLLDDLTATGCPWLPSYSFDFGPLVITGTPRDADGTAGAYAPRRIVLDDLVVRAAEQAGAELRQGFSVTELIADGDQVTGIRGHARGGLEVSEYARVVIGADGVQSRVAGRVDAPRYREGPVLASAYYAYWSGVPVTGARWMIRPGRGYGLIPTNDGLTLVLAAWPQAEVPQVKQDLQGNYLREVTTALGGQLDGGRQETRVVGEGVPNRFRQPYGPGWALVGDAGYFKDPITAHGITDALRDAEDLARAVLDGTDEALGAYQSVRDDLSLRLFDITDEIASYAWDVARLRVLHRSLSQEMGREVSHVLASALPSRPFAAC